MVISGRRRRHRGARRGAVPDRRQAERVQSECAVEHRERGVRAEPAAARRSEAVRRGQSERRRRSRLRGAQRPQRPDAVLCSFRRPASSASKAPNCRRPVRPTISPRRGTNGASSKRRSVTSCRATTSGLRSIRCCRARKTSFISTSTACAPMCAATLARLRSSIGDTGRRWASRSAAIRTRAMRVMGSTLDGHNPFKLLADGIPGAREHMKMRTLVVVGMHVRRRRSGFRHAH